jgi:putative ABC transport system substrate-binding protein
MNTFVKQVAAVLAIAFLMVAGGVSRAYAEKKIGVLNWSEEKRYADSFQGIKESLKKEGFSGSNVTFVEENAGGSKVKASEIAKKFSTAKYDLLIANGTTAAVALAKDVKNVPIVFSMVYDPIDSNIARGWKSSGNNTTGSSPRVPMAKLVAGLKQLAPVKILGVLYTPGEKNSESQLKELQAEQGKTGVKIVPIPITSQGDVAARMSEAVGAVDAVYLSGSSFVGKNIPAIVEMATKGKIITISHLEDHVENGVMFGVCADPTAVGILAGEKAAKVLKGAKPASIPIEALKRLDMILNMKTAKAAGIQISPSALKSMTRVIE